MDVDLNRRHAINSSLIIIFTNVYLEFEIGTRNRKLSPKTWGKTAASHKGIDHIVKAAVSFTKLWMTVASVICIG